jgi:hypothetical protein
MNGIYLTPASIRQGLFGGAVVRIKDLQRANGAIPWYDKGVIDPWNHTEAAMGLAVVGEVDAARRAFDFLAEEQLPDGSWWAEYGAAVPLEDDHYEGAAPTKKIRDTNFCAYVATGVWHHYRITGDRAFLEGFWPVVEKAIGFVLDHQTAEGDVRWAAADPETPENDALVTGCSSIYKSLECAVLGARELGRPDADWVEARARLGEALRDKPWRFDRDWESKARFSMDWYYPVLSGALRGNAARARLAARWETFVEPGLGCRCVEDEPWVTVAESCELVMALLAAGQTQRAKELFSWQHQWRDETGAYWMGWQFRDQVFWPAERPAWTAGAVLLAADALTKATPAGDLFTTVRVEDRTAGGAATGTGATAGDRAR